MVQVQGRGNRNRGTCACKRAQATSRRGNPVDVEKLFPFLLASPHLRSPSFLLLPFRYLAAVQRHLDSLPTTPFTGTALHRCCS